MKKIFKNSRREKESNSTQYNSTHFNISYGKSQHNKISYGKMKKDNTQKRGKRSNCTL